MHGRLVNTLANPGSALRQGYTEAVDIWSAGVIVFILLSGYAPFDDDNDVVLYQKIRAGDLDMDDPVWRTVSPAATDFLVHHSSNQLNFN